MIVNKPSPILTRTYVGLLILFILLVTDLYGASVAILVDDGSPQAVFASEEIEQALITRGCSVKKSGLAELEAVAAGVRIVLCPLSDTKAANVMKSQKIRLPRSLKSEGYSIRTVSKG